MLPSFSSFFGLNSSTTSSDTDEYAILPILFKRNQHFQLVTQSLQFFLWVGDYIEIEFSRNCLTTVNYLLDFTNDIP
jgi:hypothetical protein